MLENESNSTMVSFENPDAKPLEELKFQITNDGISREIAALSDHWVEKRSYLHYVVPDIYSNDGVEIQGAKEEWLEILDHMIWDLKWLLGLPHYKFWSHVIYESSIMNMLVSVLQESPPFYALENFPRVTAMKDTLNILQQLVLLVFVRLTTNKESSTAYMTPSAQGNLLYDNYVFTVAIIWDLCQLYARENLKTMRLIIESLFKMQPAYENDLEKSIPFLIQVLRRTEQRFEDCPVPLAGEVVSLSERGGASIEMDLPMLEDNIIHLLDVSSSLAIFLETYPPATKIFHKNCFMNRIISVYENIIPEMYKKLEQVAFQEKTMEKYIELEHRLNVTRVELIKLYHAIIFMSINNILEKTNTLTETEVKEQADNYLGALLDALSEKGFINDYHQMFPIDMDLDVLSQICPEVDTIKCDFILQSLYASLHDSSDVTQSKDVLNSNHSLPTACNHFENVAGPSGLMNSHSSTSQSVADKSHNSTDGSELDSLISKVKDILPHLGEGFIEKCLERYNNDSASVINAILEDSLAPDIKELDTTLPRIPPDPMQASVAVDLAMGMERLNVFDNDEFDIMTKDHIDPSKVHKGKRKGKHKDLNELLNDKSYRKNLGNIYSKYSLIADNDYEDEYDDTYESHDVGPSFRDEPTEMDARPFTTPRILQSRNESDSAINEDVDDDEEEGASNSTNNVTAHFLQDPAVLRAKAEQRRQAKRGESAPRKAVPAPEKDVVGKPKGSGQDKQVLINRVNKNTHKSSRANHNRRSGAQWKRKQGMVPS